MGEGLEGNRFKNLSFYSGKWVAFTENNKIVSSARTYEALLKKIPHKEQTQYIYTRISDSNSVCLA